MINIKKPAEVSLSYPDTHMNANNGPRKSGATVPLSKARFLITIKTDKTPHANIQQKVEKYTFSAVETCTPLYT